MDPDLTNILSMSQYQKRLRIWRARIEKKMAGGSQETMYTPLCQSQVLVQSLGKAFSGL